MHVNGKGYRHNNHESLRAFTSFYNSLIMKDNIYQDKVNTN